MNKTSNDKIGLNEIMKRAQEMQKKLQDIQKQVAEMEVTGQSGGGVVKVTMTGRHDVKRVEIDPGLLQEDKEMVEDLVAAAVNDANRRIEASTREKMASLTSGISLPPGMKLPF